MGGGSSSGNGSHEHSNKSKGVSCNWHILWTCLLLVSVLLYAPSLFWSSNLRFFEPCAAPADIRSPVRVSFRGDLRALDISWNALAFSRDDSNPRPPPLKIALFVKKWPTRDSAGGLERHARTLHRELARRGHTVHVFTAASRDRVPPDEIDKNLLHFHFTNPTSAGNLDAREAWSQFLQINQTLGKGTGAPQTLLDSSEGAGEGLGFDIVHTESVALTHGRARGLPNVLVSWHGIAYETIHSDIVQDLIRPPGEPRPLDLHRAITDRIQRVIDEVKFFPSYAHHVATSDSVGEVLRRVYMIPPENVHIIVNGVDEQNFRPNKAAGESFRLKYGIPPGARLVMGMAGRLVKDKGHPLVFSVLETLIRNPRVSSSVFVLIAGDGPWASRYKKLGPNVKVLGPLGAARLWEFYNALDVFVNPTLRAQGLDHTTIEAMLCGKAVMASHFASVVKSLVVSEDYGYTFSPTFESLLAAIERVIRDGREVLEEKGRKCRGRAEVLFTAEKMGAAYERLFLCVARGNRTGVDYCKYPIPGEE